nr:MAG TPA: hypothetical protein [Crassvirales sp.]
MVCVVVPILLQIKIRKVSYKLILLVVIRNVQQDLTNLFRNYHLSNF